MRKKFYALLILALHLTQTCCAVESSSPEILITKLLNDWPEEFNKKNLKAVCSLFAADLVASYPETLDKNYEEMCLGLKKAMEDPDKVYSYGVPKIEQIIVDKDIAVVRLIWTLKVSPRNDTVAEIVREKGLDVFKRQKDGSWKIAISYAYPL